MIFLTPDSAGKILEGEPEVSLDLGISKEKAPEIEKEILRKIKKGRGVYFFDGVNWNRAAVRAPGGRFYSLIPTKDAPTLEIDGIRMHQTGAFSPIEDAENKLNTINLGKNHLDICTGLGYSALYSKKHGAENVLTLERDKNVLALMRINPWSKKVFSLNLILADAYSIISFLKQKFDSAVLDPPRYSLAPELYSGDFYKKLYSAIKQGGEVFHYTGKPLEKTGKNFRKGIKKRLSSSGFNSIKWNEKAQGFSFRK